MCPNSAEVWASSWRAAEATPQRDGAGSEGRGDEEGRESQIVVCVVLALVRTPDQLVMCITLAVV